MPASAAARAVPIRAETTVTPDLVDRARRGDVAAFEDLYRANAGRIHALCLRMTADPRAAEECTQRAFVRAWQKLGQFRGESSFGTWVHRIAAREVIDARRRSIRESLDVVALDRAGQVGHADRYDAGMDLERAIAGLPPAARAVFVLHDVEGYLHPEIADLLGISVGTSKSQLHRARHLLREVLNR